MAKLTYADFDKCAVRTMQLANQSAWRLGHRYIDTEHILIGLCRNKPSDVTPVLAHFGITLDQIMRELDSLVHPQVESIEGGKRPPSASARHVTEHATSISSILGAAAVSNTHVLLGMLFVTGSTASYVLCKLGVQYESLLAHIERA